MTYRDDLDAAQARASAAEHRAAVLEKELADAAKPSAPIVPRPERVEVEDRGDALTIRWRWFRWQHAVLLVFVIVWDAFLVNWYAHVANNPIAIVFPIAHVTFGLGLTYIVLTGLFNRTTVRASGDRLEIKHSPLPWRGNRTFARNELSQLFVRDELTRWTLNPGFNRRGSPVHRLCAVTSDGREVSLLRLDDVGHATYLEKTLEARLGIIDKPVA